MKSYRNILLSGTVIPLAVGAGIGLASLSVGSVPVSATNAHLTMDKSTKTGPLPRAVPGGVQIAACNPCAAKGRCNPCAAKAKCNPCAAKAKCNPCAAKNPCAASNPCNPCNPCAAGGSAELTDAQAAKAYDCILPDLQRAYGKSGHPAAVASAK